jgi:hypothetical protein
VSTLQGARQRAVSDGVRRRALARLGIDPTPEEALLHCDYAVGHGMTGLKRMKAARAWLDTLERTARRRGDRAVAAECAARGRRLEKRLAPLSPPTPSGVAGRIRRLLGG